MNYPTLATISLIVAGLVMIYSGPVVNAQSIFPGPPPPTSQIIQQPPPSTFAQPCVNNGSNVLGKDTGKQIVNQENQCTVPRNNVVQPPTSNQAPIANAGPNQVVSRGSVVILNGAASFAQHGASIVSYSWVQTAGITVALTGADTVTPTFVAPITNSTTTLSFSLTVTDSNGQVSAPATTFVSVR